MEPANLDKFECSNVAYFFTFFIKFSLSVITIGRFPSFSSFFTAVHLKEVDSQLFKI